MKVLFAFPSLVYLTAMGSTPMVIDKTQGPMPVDAPPAVTKVLEAVMKDDDFSMLGLVAEMVVDMENSATEFL